MEHANCFKSDNVLPSDDDYYDEEPIDNNAITDEDLQRAVCQMLMHVQFSSNSIRHLSVCNVVRKERISKLSEKSAQSCDNHVNLDKNMEWLM